MALLGANLNIPSSAQTRADVLEALTQIAEQSGHPELSHAPLVLVGMSMGGCFAYDFTRNYGSRVVGFIAQKGGCMVFDGASARDAPGYLFIGETDNDNNNVNITDVFESNRRQGALWALASEPGVGHAAVQDLKLVTNWVDAVLERRLPESVVPGSPVTLNSLDEVSGWLGDRQTFEIAEFMQYGGDRLQASWLPTMQAAQDWQVFVSRVRDGE
jgi:pimeloyl-ACP methyl ester carboxylesterase